MLRDFAEGGWTQPDQGFAGWSWESPEAQSALTASPWNVPEEGNAGCLGNLSSADGWGGGDAGSP